MKRITVKMEQTFDEQGRKGYVLPENITNTWNKLIVDENGIVLTNDDLFDLRHGRILARIMSDPGYNPKYFYCPYDKQGINYNKAGV